MELLKKLNTQGISIAIVHHDLNLAGLYCKGLLLMHQGCVYAKGTPNELLTEETIKQVYGTEVRIMRHPDKDVPQILL